MFLRYVCYDTTLHTATCFDPQGNFITLSNQNSTAYNQVSHICSQLLWYTGVVNLVSCIIAMVWFLDEDPLRIETFNNLKYNIILYISKKKVCAFWWFNVANWSSPMHTLNNISCRQYTADIAGHSIPHFAIFIVHHATALYVKSSKVATVSWTYNFRLSPTFMFWIPSGYCTHHQI